MQYMDLCQLINAIKYVEYLVLKNLKIILFREDDKELYYLNSSLI